MWTVVCVDCLVWTVVCFIFCLACLQILKFHLLDTDFTVAAGELSELALLSDHSLV